MVRRHAVLGFAALSLTLACAQHEPTPQQRHAELYKSVRRIEGAISVGVNNPRLTELIQAAAAEILVARDHVRSPDETTMVKMYADALEAYSDSLKLWQKQIDYAGEDYMKGHIPVEAPIDRLPQAYGLETVDWKLAFSGHVIKAIPVDGALQKVWVEAGKRGEAAAKAYLALGQKK